MSLHAQGIKDSARALVLCVQLCDPHGSEVRALGVKQQPQCKQMSMFGSIHQRSVPVAVNGVDEPSESRFGGDIFVEKQLSNAGVTPARSRNQRCPTIPERE